MSGSSQNLPDCEETRDDTFRDIGAVIRSIGQKGGDWPRILEEIAKPANPDGR